MFCGQTRVPEELYRSSSTALRQVSVLNDLSNLLSLLSSKGFSPNIEMGDGKVLNIQLRAEFSSGCHKLQSEPSSCFTTSFVLKRSERTWCGML